MATKNNEASAPAAAPVSEDAAQLQMLQALASIAASLQNLQPAAAPAAPAAGVPAPLTEAQVRDQVTAAINQGQAERAAAEKKAREDALLWGIMEFDRTDARQIRNVAIGCGVALGIKAGVEALADLYKKDDSAV